MRRRDVISLLGGSVLAWPLMARAQGRRPWRIGVVSGLLRPTSIKQSPFGGFLQGMRDLGYAEDEDFVVEWCFAEGKYQRYAEFAAELVRLPADVIVVTGSAAIPVIQKATSTIPIVMAYSIDPVGNGLVASLAHPGGNTTGMASPQEQLVSKQLELLARVKPDVSRVAVLTNPESPNHPGMLQSVAKAAAGTDRVAIVIKARNPQELEDGFASMVDQHAGALLALPDSFFNASRSKIAELAIRHRLPTMFAQIDYARAGGLMSYGERFRDFFQRAAKFVDKILKGENPAQIPVEQPDRFHLVINLHTAKALGLDIPPELLAVADEVIE